MRNREKKVTINLEAIHYFLTETDYRRGESRTSVFNEFVRINKNFNAVEELLSFVGRETNTGLNGDMLKDYPASLVETARINYSFLSDKDGFEPSESQIKEWKKGNYKLYTMEYILQIQFSYGTFSPTIEEMKDAFPKELEIY